tara:strand:- start:120 stop:1028 length:909 start_codon:yes stop_codon:yes gene_type:complete
MNKIRISLGIIGDGYHYKKNIKPIIVGLKKKIDLKVVILKKINNKYDYYNFFKKKLDICYLSTPTKTHFFIAKLCLDNNISVISEKPLCETYNQAKILVSKAKNKKLFLCEAFMFVYHPVFAYIKKLVNNNKSDLLFVKSEFTIPSLNKTNNRYDLKKGGGFYNDLAIYPIALENYLFNNTKISKKNNFIYFEKKIPLRGYLNFRKNNFERFYFWGEGQKYKNNLTIILKNFSIYVENFYSKNDKLTTEIEFNGKKNTKKVFTKCNHFYLMFFKILNNFKISKFQNENYKNIINLSKIKKKL